MKIMLNGFLKNLWQPQLTSIRLMARINIQRPKPSHFTRRTVEKLCIPFFKETNRNEPPVPFYELCEGFRPKEPEIDNPYEYYLGKSVLEWFTLHNFIFFFHLNSMEEIEELEMRVDLKKIGINCKQYDETTMKKALTGTIYEPSLNFFQNNTLIGCAEEVKISMLLKLLKKLPKIVLIGAIIEGRLLNVSEIQYYSELGDITNVRSMLVSTLNSVGGNIIQQLNHHPKTLAQYLKQHSEQ